MTFRQCREGLRLSQEELAASAGVLQATISQIERGSISNPRFDTVMKLATAMRMSAEELHAIITETVAFFDAEATR